MTTEPNDYPDLEEMDFGWPAPAPDDTTGCYLEVPQSHHDSPPAPFDGLWWTAIVGVPVLIAMIIARASQRSP